MYGSDAETRTSPVQLVQCLYDAVRRVDIESVTLLMWADACWQAGTVRGRGGAELFTALLDLLLDRQAEVCQVVAQGATVVVLGTLSAVAGEPATDEFAHIWQLQEGRVARVRLFGQPRLTQAAPQI